MIEMPYQNLKIWQKAMELGDLTYDFAESFPKQEVFGLAAQVKRAAISVPSNIAEGSQRTSKREFANFVLISKGSLAELETQVLFAERRGYGSLETAKEILAKTEELHKMLYSFYKKLMAVGQ